MMYYKLDYPVATKEVGTQYPQVWDFIKGYNPEPEARGIFSLYELWKNGFPKETPDLSGLKLANGAQFSNFLSQGFTSDLLLFEEKAKDMLETMQIDGDYRVYSAQVTSLRKKTVKEYFMMQVLSRNFRYVDFANSSFFLKQEGQRVPIQIDSYQDYCDKVNASENPREWVRSIRFKRIKMSDEFQKLGKDLFQIGVIDNEWYVSERFVQAVQDLGLTGLEFKEM